MYEVEIKVPADHARVEPRLRELGAERAGQCGQRDVYYDAPHREFAETDEALRIRHETDTDPAADLPETTRLTYKGPLLDPSSKTRSEHETVVEDAAALAGVLNGLGFEPAATVEKQRAYWSLDGFTVTLDAVDGVGEYVEVEREVADESAIDATRDAAVALLDRLGLDAGDQVRTSYLGLLLDGK